MTEVAAVPGAHPPGLMTLCVTELWERFSYYGNRSLLMLYMTCPRESGGLGMEIPLATAVYGLFTAAVDLAALPGGWVSDRWWGCRRAVVIGGLIIVMGNILVILPDRGAFYAGLILVACGTGLLKPNVSTLVGLIYSESSYCRDAGFTLFYMCINMGAFIGPLVSSGLGAIGWHWGFLPASLGMLCGLIQYRRLAHRLGHIGVVPSEAAASAESPGEARLPQVGGPLLLLGCLVTLIATVAVLDATGIIRLDPIAIADDALIALALIAVALVAGLLLFSGWERGERRRLVVIVILMLSATGFWAGFEQAGSSLTMFANTHTDRSLTWSTWVVPAGWFNALNPLFVITLAPLCSRLWMRLGRSGHDLSLPMKCGLSLILLAGGFLVMMEASEVCRLSGHLVSPLWLTATYLCFTLGELCISPIGLSAITALAPDRYQGRMMGLWFVSASFGDLVASILAEQLGTDDLAHLPSRYGMLAVAAVLLALLVIACARPITRLMSGPRPLS
jgi:POT family proton-dependent oligopeptide transporter